MNFVSTPNLPQKPVKVVVVDGRISYAMEKRLEQLGIACVKTYRHPDVYEAISGHPDILLHPVGGRNIVYAPGVNSDVLNLLEGYGFQLIKGQTYVNGRYPGSIPYNVARVGGLAFHNLKYTDPVLRSALEKNGVELVHVNQGYSKCAITVVNEKCILTSDQGIAKEAIRKGIEVFLTAPDENIQLPGVSHGLLGGCTGLIDKNVLAVSGDVYTLGCSSRLLEFLEARQVQVVSLAASQVVDIGSILPIVTE